LQVEKAGTAVGLIPEGQVLGEMAYLTRLHTRTATVRVGSPQAVVLKIRLSPEELATPPFSGLKQYLGLQAWDRFVSASQSTT